MVEIFEVSLLFGYLYRSAILSFPIVILILSIGLNDFLIPDLFLNRIPIFEFSKGSQILKLKKMGYINLSTLITYAA